MPTPDDKRAAAEHAADIATSQVGVHEVPHYSNTGLQVDQYIHTAGLSSAVSWCMCFVYYCFSQASYTKFLLRTGSCQAQADHAKAQGILVSASDAIGRITKGWIMLQWHPDLNRYAHTGLVEAVDDASGDFWAVEGNSANDPSQRNGDGVVKQHRNIHDQRGNHPRYAFIAMCERT